MKMKTVKDIQKEISDVKKEIETLSKLHGKTVAEIKKSEVKIRKLKGRLPVLKQYLLYLEGEPTADYCKKEIKRMENRRDEILKLYKPLDEKVYTAKVCAAHKKGFEKEWELPKLRKQLAGVKYLLK